MLHLLEEGSELEIGSLVLVWNPDTVSQPFWNLRPVRWICISLVEQKYRSIVLNMTDYTTNGLIYGSCCLLIVPIFACQALDNWTRSSLSLSSFSNAFRVEILFFENNFWVSHLREGDPNYYDASGCIVWEIETLTDPSSTNSHEDSSILRCCASFKNCTVVTIHDHLVLRSLFWLSVHDLVFLNLIEKISGFPSFIDVIHEPIRREKH